MKKHRARTPEEFYERTKQGIIDGIKLEISLIKHDLAISDKYKLDSVVQTVCYNENTGNYDIVNVSYSDYQQARLLVLNEQLEDTDAIELRAYRAMYDFKKKQPVKDNSGYIVQTYYGGYTDSKIRVPRLKRKTAWKRFYKMFPNLKGKEYITGHSTGGAQRSSFIKLKKIKNDRKNSEN